MKKIVWLLLLALNSCGLNGQVTLTTEGTVVNNTETGVWIGVNIPRTEHTIFTYRNNSITSLNTAGYMLQAGDEQPYGSSNKLDGEVVSGNRFNWNGANAPTVITHGLFVGYNINCVVKYNYLDKVPYGIIFKSGTDDGINMTFTSGGCAYNICKNGKFAVRMKGINGVEVYNNTFYNDNGNGWYFVFITANMDRPVKTPSTGSKVYNNIFYSTTQFPMIRIESGCFAGFECDYNVYWCTAGEPTFNIDGVTTTWAQWRALGYDAHSIIADPGFINTTDFVPANRLDYGTNLGTEWQTGLSTSATWVVGSYPAAADQNGAWQVGARVYGNNNPVTSIAISGGSAITIDDGTLQLNASVLPSGASNQSITWTVKDGTGHASISATGLVTAVENGTVTAIARANDASGISATRVITISNQLPYTSVNPVSKKNPDSLPVFVKEGELKISNTGNYISFKANLYNADGHLITGKSVVSDSIVFDVSALPSGMYLVVFTKGEEKRVVKVVKP